MSDNVYIVIDMRMIEEGDRRECVVRICDDFDDAERVAKRDKENYKVFSEV